MSKTRNNTRIEDVRDHLFEQLERLKGFGNFDEKSISESEEKMFELELKRAEMVGMLSGKLIESAKAETDFINKVGGRSTGFIDKTVPDEPEQKKLSR